MAHLVRSFASNKIRYYLFGRGAMVVCWRARDAAPIVARNRLHCVSRERHAERAIKVAAAR